MTTSEAKSWAMVALGIKVSDLTPDREVVIERVADAEVLIARVATYIRKAWAEGRISYGQSDDGPVCAALFRCPLEPEHRGGHSYERMDVDD